MPDRDLDADGRLTIWATPSEYRRLRTEATAALPHWLAEVRTLRTRLADQERALRELVEKWRKLAATELTARTARAWNDAADELESINQMVKP